MKFKALKGRDVAKVVLGEFIDIGAGDDHDATSWQVALDKAFVNIIDESLHDTENLTEWYTMLPMIGEPGRYYADETEIWARVKIHVKEHESPWFVIGPRDQNIQKVIITEEGKDDIHTTSEAINLQ